MVGHRTVWLQYEQTSVVDPRMGRWAMRLKPEHRAEARTIAAELSTIARGGRVLAGSIVERRTRCGRPGCRCMGDPPQPHGPYFQWTRKVRAKTIGRWMSADQRDDYQPWVDNAHRMRELVARLEALGEAVLEADPRFTRH